MTSNALVRMPACTEGSGRAQARERAVLAVVLFTVYCAGYFAIPTFVDPAEARSLRTPLDDAIPFVPATIYLYAWVYTALFLPLFVVRCQTLFRRVIAAYALALSVSLLGFALYPVTSLGLRPAAESFDPAHFTTWALRLSFSLDPPYNLFPSAHVAIACLAGLVAWTARRVYGVVAAVAVVCITVAVCTVKQHYVLDALAGLALGAAAWLALVRGHRCDACAELHYPWQGPALYFVVHVSAYAAVFAVFLSGIAPLE
jgi:hypothetical protein